MFGHAHPASAASGDGLSINFHGASSATIDAILSWPDHVVSDLKRRLLTLRHAPLTAAEIDEFVAFGIVDRSTERPTPFGQRLTHRLLSETWHDGSELHSMLGRCEDALAGTFL